MRVWYAKGSEPCRDVDVEDEVDETEFERSTLDDESMAFVPAMQPIRKESARTLNSDMNACYNVGHLDIGGHISMTEKVNSAYISEHH